MLLRSVRKKQSITNAFDKMYKRCSLYQYIATRRTCVSTQTKICSGILPEESTEIVSDNVVQRYAKRPSHQQNRCLADYVSQLDIIYPKSDKNVTENEIDTNEDEINDSVEEDDFHEADTIIKLKSGIEIRRERTTK